ncbi:MAG: homoserine dehydrogenase [Gemmatimonadota bacterium]
MAKPLRVALLGFGTVGSWVARILIERPELADRLQLTHIYNRDVARKRVAWVPGSVAWTDDVEALFAAKPDVVIELIGGLDPAGGWVDRALAQGASVVTANKMLMAARGPELLRLAVTNDAQIRFEAAVGGGVPLIHGIKEGLAGDRLSRVAGILNGTCNYTLSRMEDTDESLEVVLADARRLGYAEADPSADIDGDDAAAKIVVLAGIAFHRHLRMADVPRRSIRRVAGADFKYARRLGCTIRQVALVEAAGAETFHAFVGPALVEAHSGFGRTYGADNFVTVAGRFLGESSFTGPGAGGSATAVAVVSDLLSLAARPGRDVREEWQPASVVPAPARPYYLRFVVRDRLGILTAIAGALERHGINVDAVLQEPGYPKDALPFVITVDPVEEAALEVALAGIAGADFHAAAPLALPMFGGKSR